MLILPIELLYDICFQLSLTDLQNLFLSNKFFGNNIKINWKDYFIYHSKIDEKILDKFHIIDQNSLIECKVDVNLLDDYGLIKWDDFFNKQTMQKIIVDENFMFEHGRFLIDKPVDIIKRYILLWPKLIALNLSDKTTIHHKVWAINFSDKEGYFHTYPGKKKHFHIDYYLNGDKHELIRKERCALSSIYGKLKEIILNNNSLDVHLNMQYQTSPVVKHEIIRLL